MASKKKLKLSIQNPCSEEWDTMQANERGKLCSNCRKTVIDFRNLSDNEIAFVFANSKERICGRFHKHQLNHEISVKEEKKAGIPKIAASLFALALSGPAISNSETFNTDTTEQLSPKHFSENEEKEVITKDTVRRTIKGVVLDNKTRKPVSEALVYIQGTELKTMTDQGGKFTLIVPLTYTEKNFQLIVQGSALYEMHSSSIALKRLPVHKTILLEEEKYELMGDVMPE